MATQNFKRNLLSILYREGKKIWYLSSCCLVQFSSVTQSCLTLWDPIACSMPGLLVHHQLLELAQTHVHQVGDAIQLSYPLLSPSLPSIFPSIRIFSSELALHLRWTDMHTINYKKRVERTLTEVYAKYQLPIMFTKFECLLHDGI